MPNNINDRKINTYRTSVAALSDTPNADGLSGAELKKIFDGRSDEEIKTSINGLIDDLKSSDGAGNIGNAAIYDGGSETVAGQLIELRADKVSRDPDDLPSGIDAAKIGSGDVTNAEFSALAGVSSSIQGQIDAVHGSAVLLSGDQTVGGNKTFENPVVVPAPTELSHAANRKYVDDKIVELGAGDMAKAVYDTDGDGVVNAADYAAVAGTAEGAVSKSGDTMTGALKITVTGTAGEINIQPANNGAYLESYASGDYANRRKLVLYNPATTATLANCLRLIEKFDGSADVPYYIYHTGNKPAPADIGAVSKTGNDTMAGYLGVNNGFGRIMGAVNSANATYAALDAVAGAGNYARIAVVRGATSGVAAVVERYDNSAKTNSYTLLHTGNVTAGTAAITAGTTALATGSQYLQYE